MLADAEHTTAPAAAEAAEAGAAIAAAEGIEPVVLAANASPSPAVLKAQAAADAYDLTDRARLRWGADLDKLDLHRICVKSEGLRRLLAEATALKQAEGDKSLAHNRSQVFEHTLTREGGTSEEVAAAKAAESGAEADYMAARLATEAAALKVAHGPFADIGDALARADAYARLVGTDELGEPESAEDSIEMGASYKAALLAMAERPAGADDFGDAVSTYRDVERRLGLANDEHDDKFGSQVIVRREHDSELIDRLTSLYAERDKAQNAILAGQPASIDDLLVQMEVVFDQGQDLDVSSYAARARGLTAGGTLLAPLTVEELREDDRGRRGLALIATNAARLRDQHMAADWRDLFSSVAGIHPNAADAARRAYEAGMHSADLTNIQLTGQPEDRLPTLTFRDGKSYCLVGPSAAWAGEKN